MAGFVCTPCAPPHAGPARPGLAARTTACCKTSPMGLRGARCRSRPLRLSDFWGWAQGQGRPARAWAEHWPFPKAAALTSLLQQFPGVSLVSVHPFSFSPVQTWRGRVRELLRVGVPLGKKTKVCLRLSYERNRQCSQHYLPLLSAEPKLKFCATHRWLVRLASVPAYLISGLGVTLSNSALS